MDRRRPEVGEEFIRLVPKTRPTLGFTLAFASGQSPSLWDAWKLSVHRSSPSAPAMPWELLAGYAGRNENFVLGLFALAARRVRHVFRRTTRDDLVR